MIEELKKLMESRTKEKWERATSIFYGQRGEKQPDYLSSLWDAFVQRQASKNLDESISFQASDEFMSKISERLNSNIKNLVSIHLQVENLTEEEILKNPLKKRTLTGLPVFQTP